MSMIHKFLDQVQFKSYDDFMEHYRVNVPEHFNFAYDVIDAYAATQPDKEAILYVNDNGDERHLTYGEYKLLSDEVASYLHSIRIGRGDCVMLILKRRLEWWITMAALHKIGAIAIPATHLLTSKDIIFRCHEAEIKAIITVGETVVLKNVIRRARPCWFYPERELLIPSPKDFSFPSGHTLSSFIAAFTLFRRDRKAGAAALILASCIAFSRLYLYVHFPSDIIGGVLLGYAVAGLTGRIFEMLSANGGTKENTRTR